MQIAGLFFCLFWTELGSSGYGQFASIINIPPAPNIGDHTSIGSDTQLNLFDGGAIGLFFNAGNPNGTSTNVEVNIFGGSVNGGFRGRSGSTVNIVDGSIVGNFAALSGSTVNISGGSLGNGIRALNGSRMNIMGGGFRLDGVPVAGLSEPGNSQAYNFPYNSVLSGILADGTPFAFSSLYGDGVGDEIADGTLTLNVVELPPIGSSVIMVPSDPVPRGVRTGQTLIVDNAAKVPNNFNADWGSTLLVRGGVVGENLEAVGADVTISGGFVGSGMQAVSGSTVNISGGLIAEFFSVAGGSTVNVSGGRIQSRFEVYDRTRVNISGGTVLNLWSKTSTAVNMSGG